MRAVEAMSFEASSTGLQINCQGEQMRIFLSFKTRRIKKESAQRLIELDTAIDRDAYRANLERWFNEDPQHRAAFDSMEQAWKAVDDLKIFHMRGGKSGH